MKLIFTHENRFIVTNAQNILEAAGYNTFLKNEYAAGAAGDLSPLDSWMEVWLLNDDQYPSAKALLENALSQSDDTDWQCQNCQEFNDSSFEFCWNCQTAHN